jgi:hypothetical protein
MVMCFWTLSIVLFVSETLSPERGASFIDWAKLCRFHLKMETMQSPKRRVF